jgi:integrase
LGKGTTLEVAGKIKAKLLLNEMKVEKVNTKKEKFSEISALYIDYIKAMRRASTFETYNHKLTKHISPVFKNRMIEDITRGEILDYLLSKIKEGFSRSTVCLHRNVLSGIFNYAIDEEIIKANPVTGITKRLELSRSKTEVDPLRADEIQLLLETSKRITPKYHPFFLTASRTGMRLGELLALRWTDVDFYSNCLWVRRTYRRGMFTPPKNGKARKVDMSDQLVLVLKELSTNQKRAALKNGSNELSELLFNRNGKMIEQNHIRRAFNRVLKKAKIRYVKLHTLRHTFASLLLSMGESPVYVKEQLGHHSIQVPLISMVIG